MRKKTHNLIYSIEGLDAEELYNNYVRYLDDQRATLDFTSSDSSELNAVSEQYLRDFSFKDPGKPSEAITINKFKILIHLLILVNQNKDKHCLNATILQKVIGPHYNLMLRSLCFCGLISKSYYFKPSVSSYSYTISEPYKVKIRPNKNYYVQNGLNKLTSELKKQNKKVVKQISNVAFRKQYESNLNKLKLVKYDIHSFINQLPYSEKSKVTYFEVFNKLKNKESNITEDNRGRTYTTLTRTPKIMRNLMSIKFQSDVSNSHPLLFTYFLIKKYNIELHILQDLYNTSYSYNNKQSTIIHNAGKNLYKKLKNSTKESIRKNQIPKDVILYIYMCSNGLLWKHFKAIDGFNKIPKFLIKVKLFQEVFYSNKITSWNRTFAKAFKRVYPTVYSQILSYRREVKQNKGDHLAHKMTKLESEIFRKILQLTWDNGMETVNIHDAVVVLNTNKNREVTEAQVNEIIKSVYRQYGLLVTTSVDYFSIEQAEEELRILKNNQSELLEFEYELKDKIIEAIDVSEQNYYFKLWDDFKNGAISVEFENGQPYVIFNN
jgi:hypothetical protein